MLPWAFSPFNMLINNLVTCFLTSDTAGCFSKDQVYLDGILKILRYRDKINFPLLMALGKVRHPTVFLWYYSTWRVLKQLLWWLSTETSVWSRFLGFIYSHSPELWLRLIETKFRLQLLMCVYDIFFSRSLPKLMTEFFSLILSLAVLQCYTHSEDEAPLTQRLH